MIEISEFFDFVPSSAEFMRPSTVDTYILRFFIELFGYKAHIYEWFLKRTFVFGLILSKISTDTSVTEYPVELVFEKFFEIVDREKSYPFFAWIHLFPPHAPYLPPAPYIGMFNVSGKLRSSKEQVRGIYLSKLIDITKARYEEFLRYCDSQFEKFINGLRTRNLLKNTIIILSSDHGESFEHDIITHGFPHLYEELTNIPLIIKIPDERRNGIIEDIVEQVDIPPTILDLANIPVPSWMEGRSLVKLMRGERLPPRPAFAMHLEKNQSGQPIEHGTVAVWMNNYKLIHYLDEGKTLLFNLKTDPEETIDIFQREPEIGRKLLATIKDEISRINKWTQGKTPITASPLIGHPER
jgi:arylsulfatase A-like enzyme